MNALNAMFDDLVAMGNEMIKCSNVEYECIDACDFCKHYEFNGDREGRYTGDGWCNKHDSGKNPGDTCEHFHCFKAVGDA